MTITTSAWSAYMHRPSCRIIRKDLSRARKEGGGIKQHDDEQDVRVERIHARALLHDHQEGPVARARMEGVRGVMQELHKITLNGWRVFGSASWKVLCERFRSRSIVGVGQMGGGERCLSMSLCTALNGRGA
eukprot:133568-Chlamydomonas_euryale.AAC.3